MNKLLFILLGVFAISCSTYEKEIDKCIVSFNEKTRDRKYKYMGQLLRNKITTKEYLVFINDLDDISTNHDIICKEFYRGKSK